MIKVCHISIVHQRNDIRIFQKECKSIKKKYDSVNLIIADGKGDSTEDGIHIFDIGKPKNRKVRFFKYSKLALRKAIKINADLYHLHDPELLKIALKLRNKHGKKVVFDSHEDLPRQIIGKPYIPKSFRKPIANIVEKYENRITKQLDGIITATPFIRDRFLKINNNTIDINNYPLNHEIIIDKQQHQKQNKVCYIGAISKIRGINKVIEAFKYVESECTLDLAGKIPETYQIELSKSEGWKKVTPLGFINRESGIQVKNTSVAGIVTFLSAPNHTNAQPNKIFEYMASGLPIIGSNFPLWRMIIEKNNCGICVDPSNPKEIAKAIDKLIKDPEYAREMGKNGQRLVKEEFNWDHEEIKLLKFYNSINKQEISIRKK